MYRDNTLIPSEAVRLAALGALADRAMTYAQLAEDVRHFTQRIAGPSLDLVGPPLELLIVEGLAEPAEPGSEAMGASGPGLAENVCLRLTDAGRAELERLMTASVRAPINDMSKLILALKMRFLHLLPDARRQEQTDLMVEMIARELARLTDLRATYAGEPGYFLEWLDQDIAAAQARLAWFEALQTQG